MTRSTTGAYESRMRCKEKRSYRDEIAAKLALARTTQRTLRSKDAVRTYQCPHCQGWHLTSKRNGY